MGTENVKAEVNSLIERIPEKSLPEVVAYLMVRALTIKNLRIYPPQ